MTVGGALPHGILRVRFAPLRMTIRMGFLRFANAPVEMTKDNGRNDEWFIIVMSPSRSPKGLPARRDPDRIKKICIIDFAIIHIFYVA